MDITVTDHHLFNLAEVNILLGKNGSGKSTLLRLLDEHKGALPNLGIARYITPERGGELEFNASVETNSINNEQWSASVRRSNRYDSFRQLSFSGFRKLENLVLRKIEGDRQTREDFSFTFESQLTAINVLLDEVKIVRASGIGFEIVAKNTDAKRSPGTLSNGESELISLAIEILSFAYEAETLAMKAFNDSGLDRMQSDLKDLRNILMMLAGSNKPWEVAVGQAIARLPSKLLSKGDHSLSVYLGKKLVDALQLKPLFGFVRRKRTIVR